LTDTSLYIYICVKHFGMANIKNEVGKTVYMEETRNRHRILLAEAVETTWTRLTPSLNDDI